jgi:hypothetical protein
MQEDKMKYWSLLIGGVVVAVLTACGPSENQTSASAPPVPTSPNAAYQTAFPVVGATDVTVLEGRVEGGEVVITPTSEAAPEVVTEAVNEEVTVSPETIQVEEQTAPATP